MFNQNDVDEITSENGRRHLLGRRAQWGTARQGVLCLSLKDSSLGLASICVKLNYAKLKPY